VRGFEKAAFGFLPGPCAYRVRAIDGSHQGTIFEAFSKKFVPIQEFVQQHSGDWTMTGKVPVARVEGRPPLPGTKPEG